MGCQRSKCSVCNNPYKACQLVEGKCNTCFMASQPQVPENNIITSAEIVEMVQQKTTDNKVYYN